MSNELINNDNEINNIFDNIKDLVINSRNKVYQTVNTEMLNLYWNIGIWRYNKVMKEQVMVMLYLINYLKN
ncbi:MAG: hypothetical protein U0L98_01245 [Clostridia bacterium]|nr:hypothetical protein [Clostridia bacterium]